MTGPLFPGNYSTIWIRGRFITMDGQPVRGKLSLFPTVTGGALVNRSQKLIMSSALFSADTGNDGYVAVQVPATNDPDLTPVNFTYSVTTPIGQMFSIVVPYDTAPLNSVGDPLHGQPVIELIDMVPVGSSGGVGQLLRGIGIQSMVDNGAGGLLITYSDGSTTTIAMPATVAG
ncbi:MAG: Collagen triple helix repeat-containing protein, partial [Streptosporangiaceae bacterium]|nr:Collagen triple helix repeat-containing protein [Streptosporangiaceae bacterium]